MSETRLKQLENQVRVLTRQVDDLRRLLGMALGYSKNGLRPEPAPAAKEQPINE